MGNTSIPGQNRYRAHHAMIVQRTHKRWVPVSSSRGVALLYVIAVSGIIALLIGFMMTQYILRTRAIDAAVRMTQSFYTSEAGIKMAFYYLSLTGATDKGITWRTGSIMADEPLRIKVFDTRDDEVLLSVMDDCGFLKIRSQTAGSVPHIIELRVAGILPEKLKSNLMLRSDKPLILTSGGRLMGTVTVNQTPLFQGGSIEGVLETNDALQLPQLNNNGFVLWVNYCRQLLATPTLMTTELFSPQVFTPESPPPSKALYVNDAVLIESDHSDDEWSVGNDMLIVATAEVQISGNANMSNAAITAIGPVRILDDVNLRNSRVYSETSIEIRGNAVFSGVIIAPHIMVGEQAQIINPSVLYTGKPFANGNMHIMNDTPLECTVINLTHGEKSKVKIEERAKITGLLYSHAPVTLRGEIAGYVYCHGFLDEEHARDTTNTNILAGTIRPPDTLMPFLIPVVLTDIQDFSIIEWKEF